MNSPFVFSKCHFGDSLTTTARSILTRDRSCGNINIDDQSGGLMIIEWERDLKQERRHTSNIG